MENDELLTLKEVCERLKYKQYTVRKLLKAGKLKGRHIGGHWRIKESDLQAFIDGEEGNDATKG